MRIALAVVTQRVPAFRRAAVVLGVATLVSGASLSAHFVNSLGPSGSASAFVSSPTDGADAPAQVKWGSLPTGDTGLRVACFYVANTSQPRFDRPDWPRVTGVGFELPGSASGFALVEPLDGDWQLVEGVTTSLDGSGNGHTRFCDCRRSQSDGPNAWTSGRSGRHPARAAGRSTWPGDEVLRERPFSRHTAGRRSDDHRTDSQRRRGGIPRR